MSRVPISSRLDANALRFTVGTSFSESSASAAPVVAASTTVTSESIGSGGFSSLTFWVTLTRSAATQLQFYVEHSINGGSTWHRKQGSSAAVSGTGATALFVDTMIDHQAVKDVAASDTFPIEIDINAHLTRLVVTSTAGDTDTIAVRVQKNIK